MERTATATAAMMLAGFQQYGLNPGPLLFAERPDLVWGLIASLFIANAMLLVLNLPLVSAHRDGVCGFTINPISQSTFTNTWIEG